MHTSWQQADEDQLQLAWDVSTLAGRLATRNLSKSAIGVVAWTGGVCLVTLHDMRRTKLALDDMGLMPRRS